MPYAERRDNHLCIRKDTPDAELLGNRACVFYWASAGKSLSQVRGLDLRPPAPPKLKRLCFSGAKPRASVALRIGLLIASLATLRNPEATSSGVRLCGVCSLNSDVMIWNLSATTAASSGSSAFLPNIDGNEETTRRPRNKFASVTVRGPLETSH